MKVNMDAIQRKSEIARPPPEMQFWLSNTGTFVLSSRFLLLVNLPGGIANPFRELLTESIKEIAAKKLF